ncbi:hypothetical protein GCM10010522_35160 [Kribbella solani]
MRRRDLVGRQIRHDETRSHRDPSDPEHDTKHDQVGHERCRDQSGRQYGDQSAKVSGPGTRVRPARPKYAADHTAGSDRGLDVPGCPGAPGVLRDTGHAQVRGTDA